MCLSAGLSLYDPDGCPCGVYTRLFYAVVKGLCDKNADSVTVPLIAMSQQVSGWQAANAKLQRSRLGHGNAAHRQNTGSGWVQHGHHAAFRLVCFQALGGYDTRLEACEDVDYDRRLIAV